MAQQIQALAAPVGIWAFNDEYAAMLMRAVEQVELAIPNEVSLIGVGNRPICKLLRPQLTSVQNKT